jgi:hypothetical protein
MSTGPAGIGFAPEDGAGGRRGQTVGIRAAVAVMPRDARCAVPRAYELIRSLCAAMVSAAGFGMAATSSRV